MGHVLDTHSSSYPDTRVPAARSNWFGLLPAPVSFDQLCVLFETPALDNANIWRGQSDASWRIDSGAVRRIRNLHPPIDNTEIESHLRGYEEELINDVRRRWEPARTYSELEILASLQHHGAATRLLDFSENAMVALWFACNEDLEKDGLIFGADTRTMYQLSSYKDARSDIHDILDSQDIGHKAIAWRPNYLFDRMRVQQSIFIFGNTQSNEWGSIPIDLTDTHPQLSAIVVTPSLKIDMLRRWSTILGYSAENLFPDLEGFSRAHGPRTELPLKYRKRYSSS